MKFIKAIVWASILFALWFFVSLLLFELKMWPLYPDQYGYVGALFVFVLYPPFAFVVLPITYYIFKRFKPRQSLLGHLLVAGFYFLCWNVLTFWQTPNSYVVEVIQESLFATAVGTVSWLIFWAAMEYDFTGPRDARLEERQEPPR